MKAKEILAFFLILSISQSNGENILVFIGMGSYSHRVPIQPLVDALADKGHNVTILSSFIPKNPNPKVKEINPPKLMDFIDNVLKDGFDVFKFRKNNQIIQSWFMLPPVGLAVCEQLYTDPEYVKWMTAPETKFDMVIMDSLANECAYGMAYHFKAKLVAFNTGQIYSWNLESNYGIPDESSSIPDGMLHNPTKMSLLQRAANALAPLVWKAFRELWYFPKLEEITKSGLGLKEIPSFAEIEANTSLFLLNNFWAQEFPRSLPPNVIPIGGISMKGLKSKPLPKKIEDFIEKGKEGFIYVSFGTVAEFTKFDHEVRQQFVNMISKFPNIQFIWKSTYPLEEELPENVMVEKWLPQTDILTHPKLRLYITHGGLGGIYEAIHSKVPMICFPIFAEQEYNADLMVHKGYGIKLELINLTEPQITSAISKILKDPSYKKQVEKVAKLLNDRPISPLDSAVWWVEFTLRHDNMNEFIRPLSVTQSWWVRRQLDAWALIFITTMVALSLLLFISYTVLKLTAKLIREIIGSSKQKNIAGEKGRTKQRAKLD